MVTRGLQTEGLVYLFFPMNQNSKRTSASNLYTSLEWNWKLQGTPHLYLGFRPCFLLKQVHKIIIIQWSTLLLQGRNNFYFVFQIRQTNKSAMHENFRPSGKVNYVVKTALTINLLSRTWASSTISRQSLRPSVSKNHSFNHNNGALPYYFLVDIIL